MVMKKKANVKTIPSTVYVSITFDGDLLVGRTREEAYDLAKTEDREVISISAFERKEAPKQFQYTLRWLSGEDDSEKET